METTPTVMKVIPKKVAPVIDVETGIKLKKKVAAYARVSTDMEDQKNSFKAQLEEYESRISKNPDWEFVELYSDEGISGTSTKHREGFLRMVDDAIAGKIDLILVKSISRFARNTVDCLSIIREFRKHDVEVWFDKEAISTNNRKIDMMLTVYASFAQGESESISENVKWGIRKRMAKGQRKMHTSTTLGYVTDPDGKVVIDESEVEIVEEIFNLYIFGYSMNDICKTMEERGFKTGKGNAQWKLADVLRILNNEKYIGDFVMQKTVVKDVLDHKAYKNDGIEEMYILQNHHEAIIDRGLFDLVKSIKQRKFKEKEPSNVVNLLNGLVFCEDCLRPLTLVYAHPNSPYKRAVLTCKSTSKSSLNYRICSISNTIDYTLAVKALMDVFARFNSINDKAIALVGEAYKFAMTEIAKRIQSLKKSNEDNQIKLSQLIQAQIKENDVEKYRFRYGQLNKLINTNNDEINSLENEAYSMMKACSFQEQINKYKSNADYLTYDLVKDFIKTIIRTTDNELLFVLCDEPIILTTDLISEIKEKEPIYSSEVSDSKRVLKYKVIRLERK